MSIGKLNVIGIVLVILIIIGVAMYSVRRVKKADDFATGGGKAGGLLVCGTIMGSLVSGQATVGTAQLAFTYGMSAWWFTLGAGIGCLILAIMYVVPLRHSNNITLLQIIGQEYGKTAEILGSGLCTIGIFISVIAQVIASSALIITIFPMPYLTAAIISAVLMIVYVIFGGAWGAGMGGIVKLVLLYASGIIGLIVVIMLSGGMGELYNQLTVLFTGTVLGNLSAINTANDVMLRYGNMFARGLAKDSGSCISIILGVLATQTYAQAIWSAKSDSSARKGAFLSALLIPPIGIACTLIGLFMRTKFVTQDEVDMLLSMGKSIPDGMGIMTSTAQAFPMFAVSYLPNFIGGIVIGTLLITIISGGAGLTLGMATILVNDILFRINQAVEKSKKYLLAMRMNIFAILLCAVLIAWVVPGAIINDFGFLSMGLRATVVLLPMTAGLFLKGRINKKFVLTSMIVGPLVVLLGNFLKWKIDSLYIGLLVCVLLLVMGIKKKQAE